MDNFRTLKWPIIGCLLLLVVFIPIKAQNSNVLGQLIRLPKSKGTIYQLLGLVTKRSGYLFIYDSTIINNEQTTSIKGGDYTIQEAVYAITGNKGLAIRAIENHLLLYVPENPSVLSKGVSVLPDSIQTYFMIEGSLQDQYTHEPIAFGSVGINEAAIGTITNQNGDFRLKLPDSLRLSKVRFSHIGYLPREMDSQELAGKHTTLSLEPKVISIQEVIVRLTNPKHLLQEMLDGRKNNYAQHPIFLTTFYREGIERKKGLVKLTEAVFKIYKASYHTKALADQVKLLKMRRISNEQEKDTLITKMRSGIYSCLILDLMKQLPEFLDPSQDSRYTYAHTDITVVDDRLANVISFEQLKSIDEPLYRGQIYIDTENNALLRVDFEVAPRYIEQAIDMFVEKKSRNLRITPQKVTYTVSYKQWNDTYYINHIRGDLHFKIKKRRQLFNTGILHTWFEMVTCKIDTANVYRFSRIESLPTHTVFSDTHFTYDEGFWGDFNIILPEEKLNEAISKITSKIEEIND